MMYNKQKNRGILNKWILICFILFCGINAFSADKNLIVQANDRIILENAFIKLVFADGNQFRFLQFSTSQANRSWLPETGDFTYLWKLTLKGPNGINPEVRPMNGVYQGASITENSADRAVVTFTWKMRLSKTLYYPVRVSVALTKNSGLSDWKIETDLPAGWVVSETDFPRFTVKRTDQTRLIMPAGWGVEYKLGCSSEYSAQYPSCSGSMQLFCLYEDNDNKESLYYATHDKAACIKNFSVKSSGNFATLTTEIVASEAWTPASGGTFTMPFTTSVGIDPEGWQSAVVDWYRPFTFETVWGSKSFESRKLPQWVLDADMWLRPHFTTDDTWSWLEKGIRFFGPQAACHWYRWHQIEYDVDYPEYFPAKENFKSQMQAAQKMGSHVIPYINGRLWDPQSVSYQQQGGAESSCRKADGTLYTEIYGSMVPNSVTCPSTKVWQDMIAGLANRIQGELGSNGVYIDQIGASAGMPCWNPKHDHPMGGGGFWHSSYRVLLEKVRSQLRPGNILITEENAECFMDLLDIMLMVNTPQSDQVKVVPLYPLVYSDRMMLNCFLYYPLSEKVNSMTFRAKNVTGLLWGTQLGWIKPELIMAPEAREEAEFLREMVRFRNKQHDLIYGGRFIEEILPTGDNPVLNIPNLEDLHAVRGVRWIGANGKKAILLVNMDNVPHKVIMPDGKELLMNGKECKRINYK